METPWDCFVCVNVRSCLDPKDLEEYVPGRSRCRSVTGRCGHKDRTRIRDYRWHQCKVRGSESLLLKPRCRGDNPLQENVVAAIQVTAGAGNLQWHLAVHIHLAHRHAAVRNAGCLCGSSHGTRYTGEGRLRRKRRNHCQGDDLEEPFHQLEQDYNWQNVQYVL